MFSFGEWFLKNEVVDDFGDVRIKEGNDSGISEREVYYIELYFIDIEEFVYIL